MAWSPFVCYFGTQKQIKTKWRSYCITALHLEYCSELNSRWNFTILTSLLSCPLQWCKNEKYCQSHFWEKSEHTIFRHLITYNPGLKIFWENCRVSFEMLWCTIFMHKTKKILEVDFQKNWSQPTTY